VRVSGVEAELNYLATSSILNRRYVAPGAELNTGQYEPHRVFIRNARAAEEEFSLDRQGFVLAQHHSGIADFKDQAEVETRYPAEVEQVVRRLTGADCVVPLGWVLRTSGATTAAAQPPASDVHVDMTHARAQRLARDLFASAASAESGFRRFIASSLWRTFSAPPQDWPLAVCDARSVADREGVPNTMVRVPVLPAPDAIAAILPDEERLPAASVFHFNPRHRWWYFPHMTRDEIILLKLHDSDHARAWRVPHTAFRDPTCPHTTPRESIEFRTVAYFR
jgi:hypothetical protein